MGGGGLKRVSRPVFHKFKKISLPAGTDQSAKVTNSWTRATS